MTLSVRHPKDFWTGIIYVAVGLAAITIARGYGMGTASRMGPAYFPTVLGGALALIGIASIVRSLYTKGQPIGVFAFKGMVLICTATALFGALLRGAGLVPALIVLVLVSAYASVKFRLGVAVLLAIGLTVGCVLVFIKGLGIPLELFGSWFR